MVGDGEVVAAAGPAGQMVHPLPHRERSHSVSSFPVAINRVDGGKGAVRDAHDDESRFNTRFFSAPA